METTIKDSGQRREKMTFEDAGPKHYRVTVFGRDGNGETSITLTVTKEDINQLINLTDEESLTIDEMYVLNTLAVGETFEMGVHYGFVIFTRVS